MNQADLKQKISELKQIMAEYKGELNALEKQLFQALSEYQKALEEEQLKNVRKNLHSH